MTIEAPTCAPCGNGPCLSPCAQCGTHVTGGLCSYHHQASVWDGWAVENAAWCAFIHRGVPLPRLPVAEREAPAGALNDPSWA